MLSQSLWNRAGSFDLWRILYAENPFKSQSLWNRAGSFDIKKVSISKYLCVSIPLEQGGVFRPSKKSLRNKPNLSQSLWNRVGSFDLSIARGFINLTLSQSLWNRAGSFDPKAVWIQQPNNVSIPLEQGRVFRLQGWFGALMDKA